MEGKIVFDKNCFVFIELLLIDLKLSKHIPYVLDMSLTKITKIKLDNDQRARLREIKSKANEKRAVLQNLYDSLMQNCGATEFALGSLLKTIQTLKGHEARKWLKNEDSIDQSSFPHRKYSIDTIEDRIIVFFKNTMEQDVKVLFENVKLQLENAIAEAETCESTFMDNVYKENKKKEFWQTFEEWIKNIPKVEFTGGGMLDLDDADEIYKQKLRKWLENKPKQLGELYDDEPAVRWAKFELGIAPKPTRSEVYNLLSLPPPELARFIMPPHSEQPRRQWAGLDQAPRSSGFEQDQTASGQFRSNSFRIKRSRYV